MSSHDPFQAGSGADARESLDSSTIPFPSISPSAAASPAGGSSSRSGTIPRPPNAWILYRSYKLEQLKEEEADWNAKGRRGTLTANALALVSSSPDASGSSPGAAYRCSSPTSSELTVATPAPATPATPASAYSPGYGSPYPSNGSPSSTSNVSSLLAQLWKHESDEVKQSFYELAKQKQKEHKQNWPQYKFSPRVTVKSQLARQRRRSNGTNGKTRASGSACASAATSPAAEAMSTPASCAASPSVSGGEFQLPSMPGPKSRSGSRKKSQKKADTSDALSLFESGGVLPMSPRKRRTPEPPTQDDFCASPCPLPVGRKTARLPSSSHSRAKISQAPGNGKHVDGLPMSVDHDSISLPTAASPADLTSLPSCDLDTRGEDLSPTSWAARDAQTLSLYHPSPYTPAQNDYSSPMPPALPPSARTYTYTEDEDAGSRSRSPRQGGDNDVASDYFLNDPFVHRAPIFPGSELFELDPALAGVLDLNHVWRDNVDEEAKKLFDLSGDDDRKAEADDDMMMTAPTESSCALQQPEWLKSINWDLTGNLDLDLGSDLDVDRTAGPSSLTKDLVDCKEPPKACSDDIAEFLLSQAVEAGFLDTMSSPTSPATAVEPNGSAKVAHEPVHPLPPSASSSVAAAAAASSSSSSSPPAPPASRSPSPHKKSKARSPRSAVTGTITVDKQRLRPRRRGSQTHAHTASPSPPPPLPTIPNLQLDLPLPMPMPLVPSRVLRPRQRSRSTRSSPARSPPLRMSPAVRDDDQQQQQQQQQRVLRSSRGRPKVQRETPSSASSSSGASDSGHGGESTAHQLPRTSPPPSTSTSTTSSTTITLNGSYTEDELLDMLAQRRLQRKAGG